MYTVTDAAFSMFSVYRRSSYLFVIKSLFRFISLTMASTTDSGHKFYKITPAKLGIEVTGIDLNVDPPQEVIDAIKSDVHKHGLVIFRDQGIVSGQRHVQISRWFGELESTFYKHPKSPHPDVFRVSNDGSEGCRGVGRTGWHIDGSFQPAPFAYSLYYMAHIPRKGDTGMLY
jgi:alpha-ketoglutarate-dependent taurine dioxygenase